MTFGRATTFPVRISLRHKMIQLPQVKMVWTDRIELAKPVGRQSAVNRREPRVGLGVERVF
jgi:hypothetical protein